MKNQTKVDITPKPRILRTLGEIPFQPWQCFAELIDNSIDAFMRLEREGRGLPERSIHVKWSGENVAATDRVIEIEDTADGMPLEVITNMAKAGYSGNNPIDNLGLFGMGFNIATARLGEKTRVVSSREGDNEWVGIEIDFARLIQNEEFSAPVITIPKDNPSDHGTRIIINNVKPGIYRDLLNGESSIRRRLENVYTPILSSTDTKILIQGKRLSPHPHCVWSKERYVTRNNQNVPAVIEIDVDLGEELFDIERNAYVPETAENTEDGKRIIRRPRRLKGWLGIQRYSDPDDFGIDFVRNGRKILISDKTLFYYENPLTGAPIIEYPKELASTWGGRIVGELNVDFLLPTYQKNDFDRSDRSWRSTIEAIRGLGPILPSLRKGLEFADDNSSPLGKLMSAYRRLDPGTKNLSVSQSLSKEFAAKFFSGSPDYQSDERWWKAAQEADRRAAGEDVEGTPVDEGSAPSDDVGIFLTPTAPVSTPAQEQEARQNSTLKDLLTRAKKIDTFSKDYAYSKTNPFAVNVYEIESGDIWINGEKSPTFFNVDGIHCDYFYNPGHALFQQYHIDVRDPLAVYLAERFKTRDMLQDMGKTFADVIQQNNQDLRMDKTTLQERASIIFGVMRDSMQVSLGQRAMDVIACVKESAGETEETIQQMLPDSPLIEKFQRNADDAIAVLDFVPNKTLVRLVDRFPEMVLDGKVFNIRYIGILIDDEKATERLRTEAKDRLLSFLKDAVWVSSLAGNQSRTFKDELTRCLFSINFLEKQLCQ